MDYNQCLTFQPQSVTCYNLLVFFFNCIPLQLLIGKRALSELENLLVHSKLSHNEMISNNSEGFWPGSFWRSWTLKSASMYVAEGSLQSGCLDISQCCRHWKTTWRSHFQDGLCSWLLAGGLGSLLATGSTPCFLHMQPPSQSCLCVIMIR